MPARIKSEDQVIVISGKDRGKQGKVLRVDLKNDRVFVEGLNIIKRHTKAQPSFPDQPADRRRDREGGRDPRLERGARRSQGRQADPRRRRGRGRQARPRGTPQWNEDRLMSARLKSKYEDEIRPALVERFGYTTPMQAPKILKVTVNMGVGDGKQDSKMFDAAAEQLGSDHRPEAERAPRAQVDRAVQAA